MGGASVNRGAYWKILGKPFYNQFRDSLAALKDPPHLVGDLAHGNLLWFHCIASGFSLLQFLPFYSIISHLRACLRSRNMLDVPEFFCHVKQIFAQP